MRRGTLSRPELAVCLAAEVVHEHDEDYQASYDRVFTKTAETRDSRSFGKSITSVTLPEGGDVKSRQLTDGIFGSWESWSAPDVHWIAYKGKHMDFTLDLGEVMEIRFVEMEFLNSQAQPDWNLMVLPQYVSYATSIDGETFSPEVKLQNPNNPNPKENPDIVKVPIQSFRTAFEASLKARYIKVHGESMLHMPSWHIRAGQAAVLCTDQIVVG